MGLENEQSSQEFQMGLGKLSKNIINQFTNAFIFCAQFCHNNKNTIMAVGANQLKMFNLEEGN